MRPPHADAIDAPHCDGPRVFAGIGTLHETGARALTLLPLLWLQRAHLVQRVALR